MVLFGASSPEVSSVPLEFWIWGGATVLLSAGLGFVAGMSYARVSVEWAAKKAQKQVATLYALVLDALEKAHNACGVLERFPKLMLSEDQTEKLDGRRQSLVETISKVVEPQREIIVKKKEKAAAAKRKQEELPVVWVRTPEDFTTGLPARAAFEANLAHLLERGVQTDSESGLLLVRLDKADQLKARFGSTGIENFLKKMAALIIRSVRDQDVVCRYAFDTFALLLPDIDDETGHRIAQVIRNTVRNHHFRLDEKSPEVLVTASFGYTRCRPEDNTALTLDRVSDALTQSFHRGRNQLHVHDGETLVHCAGT